ncbi:MAG: hypothetical protein QXK11_11475 [Pyrobaculum sp.]|uniref:hypothetical protein n=1 Tax=Pyrobaculum sp. TaxID=2004705 RepID=UPI00317D7BF7
MGVEPRVLSNYVKLTPGVRKKLVLTRPVIEEAVIPDRTTGGTKTVRRLRFDVLEEDGVSVKKYFTTLSEKLAQVLMTIWDRRTGETICVYITERGTGLAKEYEVSTC